ncbi:serine protease 1 [Drosophila rhopaloa]|uniref:Serine proteases 1/2 n=1 Tax=Drosophila rhopaloa TaxID=1041015 RepID=A0A6P4DUN6_DRORH|nr:serine protease 1 [Drosophila rhopaloa]
MKLIFVLLLTSSLILASEDKKTKIQPRIYGGYRAKPYTVLYIVGIVLAESFTSSLEFGAGTVISNQWVLTVGTLLKYRFLELHLGSRRAWWGYKIARIYKENYYIHPNKLHDVGLIKCPYMKFSDRLHRARIPPIPVRDDRYVGNLTLICGWGKRDRQSKLEKWLQCIHVVIMSNEECAKIYPQLRTWNVCTSGEGEKGICEGDIGGPVVTISDRPILVGIIHILSGCKGSWPSIHIRTSDHLNWIRSKSNVYFDSFFGR